MTGKKTMELLIQTKDWSRIPRLQTRLEKAAAVTLAALPDKFPRSVTVTVLLTDNQTVQRLNRDFRGLDKPTNVLSFPQYAPKQLIKMGRVWGQGAKIKRSASLPFPNPPRKGEGIPPRLKQGDSPILELGDIALAYQYMVDESKKDHKILINHITHLFIHGFLHLFGYDHLTDRQAKVMEQLEQQIMANLKLPDPYQTSAGTKSMRKKSAQKK